MANLDLKREAKKAKVWLWQVADELEIADNQLSKRLRKELSDEEKAEIREIIARLSSTKKS